MSNKKLWITGKEVAEAYGIQATELGQACYAEELNAYQAGTCKQIFEETKVTKIPAHVPQGIDPCNHKKYGVNVEWEWSNKLFPWDECFHCEIHKDIFDIYSTDDDKKIDHNDISFPCLFPFRLDEYIQRECYERNDNCTYPDYGSELHKQLIEKYKQDVSEMLFKQGDIEKWLDNVKQPTEQNNSSPFFSEVKKPDVPLTVKKNVRSAENAVRGKLTRNENEIALEWIAYWRHIKMSKKDIANALFEAGAGNAVIGYLLAPDGEDLSKIDNGAACKRGQRARKG